MRRMVIDKWKLLCIGICACFFAALCSISAYADESETGLTIKYPVENVEFAFYKVAEFSEFGAFNLIAPYDAYADEIKDLIMLETNPEDLTTETWMDLATTLESYIISKNIPFDFLEKTDDSGKIIINNLEKGLYLIMADTTVKDEKIYTPSTVLMTIPNRDKGGVWDSSVVMDYTGKVTIEDLYETYTVEKIWKDDGNEKERPKEIVIELYIDDNKEVFDSVVLNVDNNWKHTWEKLPKLSDGQKWVVSEKKVPDDYKVVISLEGTNFIVENTYDIPPKPDDKIPQTGQLWWPIPFLTVFGIVFLVLGLIRRNYGERR